jgi:hypothetical protein
LPESIRRREHRVHRDAGDAIDGDQILIKCRKPGKWQTVRGSEQHHYFVTAAGKNAYAVIVRRITKVRKG